MMTFIVIYLFLVGAGRVAALVKDARKANPAGCVGCALGAGSAFVSAGYLWSVYL